MQEIKTPEIEEIRKPEPENLRNIQPKNGMTGEKAKEYWDNKFKRDCENTDLESLKNNYLKDLKEKSDCPDTIPDNPFETSDLKKISPEENALRREEFSELKDSLKKEWEDVNGRPWPKYEKDVYIVKKNGDEVKIREAGMDYDAHHIQALSHGGKNEVSNITPLRADIHYDHRGVHELGSPYDKLDKQVGGI